MPTACIAVEHPALQRFGSAASVANSLPILLMLRCTTWIGVCVEFVMAVAWIAELFPDPKQISLHGQLPMWLGRSRAAGLLLANFE